MEDDYKAQNELELIAALGGETSHIHNIDAEGIESIFEHIQVSLGLEVERSTIGIKTEEEMMIMQRIQNKPAITLRKKNFVVLFNLDCSGSMSGSRWKKVCNAVRNFVNHLKPTDLVCGVVFNEEFKLLTSPFAELLEKKRIPQIQPVGPVGYSRTIQASKY